jgi:cell division protein FtsN
MRQKTSGRVSTHHNKSRGGTLLGVFIGLIIGILIALLVVWFINRTPSPFRAPSGLPEAPGSTVRNGPDAPSGSPVPLPAKPGDPPHEKRFQFYDILPGKSEPKPSPAATDKSAKAADAATPAAKGEAKSSGPLSLQVGSFQTVKDAENMKVTLTLMGLEPSVQEVQVNGKQWFRVRVGPMLSFEELNRIKTELAKSGIQAVVVKPNE